MSDMAKRCASTRNLAALLLALAILGPARARAADSAVNPFVDVDLDMEATYRKTICDGVAEYQAGHFQEALSLFRRAHQLSPSARTWRGIGMTSFELRDYVTAMHALSAALQDTRKPLSPDQRKDAQALLERTRMFVDIYKVELQPDTAHLLLDGREPELEPDGTLLLSLGTHTLEASAPGMAALTKSVEVRGGQRQDLRLSLEPVSQPREAGVGRPPPTVAETETPAKEPINRKAVAWLLAGVGSALVATGTGIYWSRQASMLDSCHKPADGWYCATESTLSTEKNLAMAATLVTGAAAVTMAIIGAVTWRGKPAAANQQRALRCIASPFGVSCGGAF
jgi:hypothetical protein